MLKLIKKIKEKIFKKRYEKMIKEYKRMIYVQKYLKHNPRSNFNLTNGAMRLWKQEEK